MKHLACAFALVLIAPRIAAAEPAHSLVEDGESSRAAVAAYAEAGLDAAIGSTLGVATGVPAFGARLNLAVFVDAEWFAGKIDLNDTRVRAGLRAHSRASSASHPASRPHAGSRSSIYRSINPG
jgi:hypothetical protein